MEIEENDITGITRLWRTVVDPAGVPGSKSV